MSPHGLLDFEDAINNLFSCYQVKDYLTTQPKFLIRGMEKIAPENACTYKLLV